MTRITFAVCVVAILGLTQDVVGSQASASVTLVDVPIPVYPPIAQSALISGDVHVTVDVRADGTVASASVAKVEGSAISRSRSFLESRCWKQRGGRGFDARAAVRRPSRTRSCSRFASPTKSAAQKVMCIRKS